MNGGYHSKLLTTIYYKINLVLLIKSKK